jgi:hypothetical protein
MGGFLPEQVLFVSLELLMYLIFTTEYSREMFIWPVKTNWHNVLSDLIIMFSGTFVLPQMFGGC